MKSFFTKKKNKDMKSCYNYIGISAPTKLDENLLTK